MEWCILGIIASAPATGTWPRPIAKLIVYHRYAFRACVPIKVLRVSLPPVGRRITEYDIHAFRTGPVIMLRRTAAVHRVAAHLQVRRSCS